MSATFTVNFAGFFCRIKNFGASTFCDSWQWKLDPYRCADNGKRQCGLTIRNSIAEDEISKTVKQIDGVRNGFFLRQVFQLENGGTLWRNVRAKTGEVQLAYRVKNDWSEIVLIEDNTKTGGQMAFEYLCHLLPACGLKAGLLTFHGVLMEYEGKGIILSAPSGVGKTTHARLWRDNKGALILNGDRSVCRKLDGVWTGFGLPWSGTSGEQINRSVPIRAIVTLEQAEENRAEPVEGIEMLGNLLPHILAPAWNAELSGRMLELVDDFLKNIPVYHLKCRPDIEAVETLHRCLFGGR